MLSIVQIVRFKITTFEIGGLVADDICDEKLVVRCDEDILWLYISVDSVSLMELRDSAKQLENEPLSFGNVKLWDFVF